MNNSFERYARQMLLPEIGEAGQKKLLSSRVLIVGAGGLGSPIALYLAAAGVGKMGLVDSDKVEIENLHRQIIHSTKTIGFNKTESASTAIVELNPQIKIERYSDRLTEKNAPDIIKNYDCVIDAVDNFETRYILNSNCVALGTPFVHGSVLRYQGQTGVFFPRSSGGCYSCIYPEPPPTNVSPKTSTAGILGAIPGVVGTIEALNTIKLLLEIGDPLIGKLLIFDGLLCTMKTLDVARDPKCSVCSGY